MNPEDRKLLLKAIQDIATLQKSVNALQQRDKGVSFNFPDNFIFKKLVTFAKGFAFGGGSIGQAGDSLSVYGEPAVPQAAAITAPSGGGTGATDAIDISARAKINEIRAALSGFGITA